MYKKIITIPLSIVLTLVQAQSVSTLMGARIAGMGYAGASLNDSYGIFNNVAGITSVSNTKVIAAYDASPSLPGANRSVAAAVISLKKFTLACGAFGFGDKLYNEQMIIAGLANKMGIASLGLRGKLVQYHAEGFQNRTTFSIDFGGIVDFTKHISFGAYITNLNQPTINAETEEHLPTKLNAGLCFKPMSNIILSTEIEKDLEYHPTWKAGFEYGFREKFFFRSGYNLNLKAPLS